VERTSSPGVPKLALNSGRENPYSSERTTRRDPSVTVPKVPVVVRATYWQPQQDLDVAEWIIHGGRLGSIGRAVSWWIGDWVNYGNEKFGEKYTRAARVSGYDVQSLMNMAYVASRFDRFRRRERLSWSHHAELASLDPEQQEMWLEKAERASLSVRGLRDELRTWRVGQRGHSPRESGADSDADVASPPEEEAVVCPQCGYCIDAKS
jgi:hypothetical protein